MEIRFLFAIVLRVSSSLDTHIFNEVTPVQCKMQESIAFQR